MSSSSNSSSSSSSRIVEWEEGLPSSEDLTPLDHSLISPFLASAFSISLDSEHCNEQAPSKKARLAWTPQLHKRFVDVVSRLGVKNAVPKTIMDMMNVEGLTRENVASHLQKYRLYLKRMGLD